MKHVKEEGKAAAARNLQQKFYINTGEEFELDLCFEHPATFDTLGMEKCKKEEISNDLLTFTEAKKYYEKIGKPWKRGYLLYGPPGTGKSTMITAMANLLNYESILLS